MSGSEEKSALVLDCGSGVTKAGYAGDDAPRVVFPSIVARPKAGASADVSSKDLYVGDDARALNDKLELNYPIDRSVVTNWDDMEELWRHTFYNELRVSPEEHPILLCEPPLVPSENREKTTQLMFETFGAPSMYLVNDSLLALYASGRTSGIVLDSGFGVTYTVPIFEGIVQKLAMRRLELGGKDLTEYMMKMLLTEDSGHAAVGEDVANDVKEKHCYVPLDFEKELVATADDSADIKYELPDGTVLAVGTQRIRCAEALLKPCLIGLEDDARHGVHHMLYESIMTCEVDMRRDLYANIVLAGGNTLFPGFAERMTTEMTALCPGSVQMNIISPPERKFSAWIGGDVFVSKFMKQDLWLTKDAYEETGPGIVHRVG